MTKITITFPDEIAEQVRQRPDRDEFVTRVVADALAHQPRGLEAASTSHSRWARVVERIGSRAGTLGDYAETLKRDREDFRRSFEFKHDRP